MIFNGELHSADSSLKSMLHWFCAAIDIIFCRAWHYRHMHVVNLILRAQKYPTGKVAKRDLTVEARSRAACNI